VVESLPSPPHEQTEPAKNKTTPPSPAVGSPESYEKLIASGDRALENGSNSKAKEFYQKALHMRPAGADALAGLAFVALDRGQIPAANDLFERALKAKASFGPALFGMAEIHRARGEKALALQSYQRYLQVSPNGKEASAARRQVSALQSGQ
jgi:Tfp pilus assembly protein PilF